MTVQLCSEELYFFCIFTKPVSGLPKEPNNHLHILCVLGEYGRQTGIFSFQFNHSYPFSFSCLLKVNDTVTPGLPSSKTALWSVDNRCESDVIDAQPFTNVDRRNDTVSGDASLQSERLCV